jgi:F-type H+-transporting ATPase subunit epsilon
MPHRFNKYIQIAARATRQALKEEERLKADKRGTISLKWQTWKDGKGGVQVRSVHLPHPNPPLVFPFVRRAAVLTRSAWG